MSGASGSNAGGDSPDDEIVDVRNVPLTKLLDAYGDSPVLRSIRRLQTSLEDPNGVLSAFGSFIDKS